MSRDYDGHNQNIYFTRRLMIRLSYIEQWEWICE